MSLPTSGQISLNDIQTEFGGSNPINISEYYGIAGGIPTSGQIKISDFYGASNGAPTAYWAYGAPSVIPNPGVCYTNVSKMSFSNETYSQLGNILPGARSAAPGISGNPAGIWNEGQCGYTPVTPAVKFTWSNETVTPVTGPPGGVGGAPKLNTETVTMNSVGIASQYSTITWANMSWTTPGAVLPSSPGTGTSAGGGGYASSADKSYLLGHYSFSGTFDIYTAYTYANNTAVSVDNALGSAGYGRSVADNTDMIWAPWNTLYAQTPGCNNIIRRIPFANQTGSVISGQLWSPNAGGTGRGGLNASNYGLFPFGPNGTCNPVVSSTYRKWTFANSTIANTSLVYGHADAASESGMHQTIGASR